MMRILRIALSFLFVAVLLVLPGCSTQKTPLPEVQGSTLFGEEKSALLESLRSIGLEVSAFRGLARARLQYRDEAQSFRQAIVCRKPDRVRIESLPLNSSYALNVFLIRGEKLTFLDVGPKRAYTGPATVSSIQSMLELPVQAGDLCSLLAGNVPPSLFRSPDEVEVVVNRGPGIVSLIKNDFEEFYQVDLSHGGLIKAELRSGRRKKLNAALNYSNFHPVSGRQLPRHTKIILPEQDAIMDLSYVVQDANGNYRESLFEIEIPADFSVRKLR